MKTVRMKMEIWKAQQPLREIIATKDELLYQNARAALQHRKENAAHAQQIQELTKQKHIIEGGMQQLREIKMGSVRLKGRAANAPGKLLKRLICDFHEYEAKHSTNTAKTQQTRVRYLQRFLDITGHDLRCDELSAEHIRHYREIMHRFPRNFEQRKFNVPIEEALRPTCFKQLTEQWQGETLSGGGIDTAFKQVRAFLNWANDEQYLPRDFTRLLVVSKKRSVETRSEAVPFTSAQLHRLFSRGDLYGDQKHGNKHSKAWHFWVPLFGLTTGMRSSEIGALLVDDISEHDGIWCINIRGSKTSVGVRLIPVPQVLLNAGLIDYRQTVLSQHEASSPARLFPALNAKGGRVSNAIGAFFNYNKHSTDRQGNIRYNGYMVRCGVCKPSEKARLSFHSLRHGLVTQLLQTPLPSSGAPLALDLIKNIVGHHTDFAKTYGIATHSWSDATTVTYNHRDGLHLAGKAARLALMKEALDAIHFGLDLSQISYARYCARK